MGSHERSTSYHWHLICWLMGWIFVGFAKSLALLWQIYSRRCSLQIYFRQCGHRCGGSRAKNSRMAWRTAGKVG